MIPFNKPPRTGNEDRYVIEAMNSTRLSGDGPFTKLCSKWFEESLNGAKSILTTSCTHALEMTALLIGITEGDEVIMPSYTFVSTANAFVLRGAKIVFVDVNPDTMNIDELKIEAAITEKTKAIVPVHYAGVACEMDTIMRIAKKHSLFVIEDAAQGMMSTYKGKKLGTIGDFGTISFHETKNYTSGGEGGLLIINNKKFLERAEIIRDKGTNRGQYFRGMVDKYSWVDIGSSYLLNDLSAAHLYGQLERAEEINSDRLRSWELYHSLLSPLDKKISLPNIPEECTHNAHIFYIKVKNLEQRSELIKYLLEKDIQSTFHYVPLHSSIAGNNFGRMSGNDTFTTSESERLIRLPLFYSLQKDEVHKVANSIIHFYQNIKK